MNTPDVAHQAFAELGFPHAVFAPPKLRTVVGVLATGLVGCGQLLVYFLTPHAVNVEQQADKVGMLVVGVGCLALAAGILAHGLRSRGRRFFVCPGGLVVQQGPHVDVYPWDSIVRVTENSVRDTVSGIPVGTYRAAVVQRVDGATLVLNRNRVHGVGKLIDTIHDQLENRRSANRSWNEDLHVGLRVKQDQVDRGEIVTLDVPEIGSFRVTLPQNIRSGMAIRLYQALPNQRSLIAHVRIDQ